MNDDVGYDNDGGGKIQSTKGQVTALKRWIVVVVFVVVEMIMLNVDGFLC